ncbi:MAG: glycoside hydrolase family 1 protein [Candidatus Eremiobacteraeota bacterium]|nr:glycoside hydrolase family 1 protein [Candidatus Eremiobacteraeota bacterium]
MDGSRLRIWAGVEPSLIRIGDRYVDQIRLTGHHERQSDIDCLAGLGVEAVRYPVLWERIAPQGLKSADWSWTDERLDRLRALHIEPIVTLLHHGSGPSYTELLDPDFPTKLAKFARAVAKRYQWVRYFTPVNEPLTTARFSALYGHWYPHESEDCAFAKALLNQVAGIARAMEAIREEIPHAELITTEDLGKTRSTARLAYQAAYENARRWSSVDLLCGTFDNNAAMRSWLDRIGLGINERELQRYRSMPSILGFNYYVTGERFLDERIDRYPGCAAGSNGLDTYVDTETVRVSAEMVDGVAGLLSEAWNRYGLPLAITEAHLGCTREEQVRWLEEIYRDAVELRSRGIEVRAMTVWSVFGAWEWNSLMTRSEGHYESGCFDCRATQIRPTLVASWTKARAGGIAFDHPVLDRRGWWRSASASRERPRRIAICGNSVTATHCAALCELRGLPATVLSDDLPVAQWSASLRDDRVWLIIDADSGWGSRPARLASSMDVSLLVLSTSTETSLTKSELASIMSVENPLIVRYAGFQDATTWLHRALDLMLDGETGVWNEVVPTNTSRAS